MTTSPPWPSVADLRDAYCPICGCQFVARAVVAGGRNDDDEPELCRVLALQYVYDDTQRPGVACLSCDAYWSKDELSNLAEALS